ncbi:hypothetical protein BDW59DRAFT_39616 [Aspergillus cavernicola]|uniref:Transmembrane protein n=1 Tax=Aspergillus cavernicola TaxID=176166 RepID=A0ABR4IME1_9EURO
MTAWKVLRLGERWLIGDVLPRGSTRMWWYNQVAGLRLGKEHKVFLMRARTVVAAVVVVVVVVVVAGLQIELESRRLWMRWWSKPWLLKVIRGERRGVERSERVQKFLGRNNRGGS